MRTLLTLLLIATASTPVDAQLFRRNRTRSSRPSSSQVCRPGDACYNPSAGPARISKNESIEVPFDWTPGVSVQTPSVDVEVATVVEAPVATVVVEERSAPSDIDSLYAEIAAAEQRLVVLKEQRYTLEQERIIKLEITKKQAAIKKFALSPPRHSPNHPPTKGPRKAPTL